jgi:hypothetical protein
MIKLSRMLFLVLLLLAPILVQAQTQTISLTSSSFSRTAFNIIPGFETPVYKFKLSGLNTEINGNINGGSGINTTENRIDCCFYGKKFVLWDWAEGRNNFQQTTEPIIINGITYQTMYLRGEIRFMGGTIVPFHLKKKRFQTLKFPVTIRGYIKGSPILGERDDNPLFTASLNMTGTATVTIRPNNYENDPYDFDVVSVKYDLVMPTN